ncbi:MAG: ATP-dependent RecD-like DNA helicase [Deltaproteobacteria bacterium]|nr:ATP-dependent RecD-like DNA helicase [Deltaproteobacteria bacterium]
MAAPSVLARRAPVMRPAPPLELPLAAPRATPGQSVRGVVDSVVYRAKDGPFAVVRLLPEAPERDGPLLPRAAQLPPMTIVGDLGDVSIGEALRIDGRWTDHARYGRRFVVESFVPITPSTTDGITRYLGSGLVHGIGKRLAARLVDRFGDRTLDVLADQPERVREVGGIGLKRAHAIADVLRARRDEAESMSFLHGLGLGRALGRRVIRRFGADTVRVLREDPYRLAEEVAGIGFLTADRIGHRAGIAPDDPRRAAGAVLHLVGKCADEGHTFLTSTQLSANAEALGIPEDRVREVVPALESRGLLVVERAGSEHAIYAPPLHQAERVVAARLVRLARPRKVPPRAPAAIAAAARTLSDEQLRAVEATFRAGLVVITGGPGTGKTTTVRAIVESHVAVGHDVLLCAPTGRAAKRLTEAVGVLGARTIHRLLEWNPRAGTFARDAKRPLSAALVLVDETSMLDVQLAERLLVAVADGATLVLVGDIDQLPPVGPGQVLRDVLDSGVATVERLSRVFRQAQESTIIRAAHGLLRNEMPEPTPTGQRGTGDLYVIIAEEPERAAELVCRAVTERVPESYGLDPIDDVQVLTPTHRGPLGAERLNELLQQRLNARARERPRRDGEPLRLLPGDKVMQLRNDYEKEVFNGDVGRVTDVRGAELLVSMDGREIVYGPDDEGALTLAYAATVHKAQGSEFPCVVLALHTSHYVLLTRRLLYTAITRARRLVVIVGSRRALSRAVRNDEGGGRASRLAERIVAAMGAREPERART